MSTASDYPDLRPRLDWVTITLGPDGKDLPSYELIQWGPPDVWVRPRWFVGECPCVDGAVAAPDPEDAA